MLNQLFDHIYLINLQKRTEKLHLIKYQLEFLKIDYEIFKAIDGTEEQYGEICLDLLNKKNTWIKSKGAIGLILTYLELLKDAVLKNYQNILILEDDCYFHYQFLVEIEKKSNLIQFNDTISVIYLGANQFLYSAEQKLQINQKLGYYDLSNHTGIHTFGTYAISMNRYFIKLLLESIDINSIDKTIDVHIQELLNQNNLKGRIIFPFLIMPDVTNSDIIGIRQQKEFCIPRKYNLDDYCYLGSNQLNFFRNYLDYNKISIRKLFWDTYQINYLQNKNIINQLFLDLPNWNEQLSKLLKSILDYLNFAEEGQISLIRLFELIEGSRMKFVFIVPTYNNCQNCKINLKSIYKQNYPNYLFRYIIIDDQSTDDTYQILNKLIDQNKLFFQASLFQQIERGRQGLARYLGWNLTFDDEFILLLDGDDWLQNLNVLIEIENHCIKNQLLATYGSYNIYHDDSTPKKIGMKYGTLYGTRQFPLEIKLNIEYRSYDWISCHLRGAYGKLFKNIDVSHLISSDGKFYKLSTDRVEMVKILEMAGNRHLNIQKLIYIYNQVNSLKYQTSHQLVNQLDHELKEYRKNIGTEIKNIPKYLPIEWPICLEPIIKNQLESLDIINLENLENLKDDFFIYQKELIDEKILNDLIEFSHQTHVLISTSIQLKLNIYNIINFNKNNSYVIFKINKNFDESNFGYLLNLPGIYHKIKMINYFRRELNFKNELIISRYLE